MPDKRTEPKDEGLREHLARVKDIRRQLSELDERIESGDYNAETLQDFSDTYQEYIRVRSEDIEPEDEPLLRRLIRPRR